MRIKIFCLFVLLITIHFCEAQDSTVVLNTSMFDKYFQSISLTSLNGWIFKQGNDTDWSKNKIDTTGWIKLNPLQLTAKDADKEGKLEGWLRMKFKLDNSFKNINIGIGAVPWAATDIYIDGNYIMSYGNTGMDGKHYKENSNTLTAIQPLQIEPGIEHILAVHVVDYVDALSNNFLKTESYGKGLGSILNLTGPLTYKNVLGLRSQQTGYSFLYSGIIGFLSVLFWFLYLQNRSEKNILLISISTSFFFVWALLIALSLNPSDVNFDSWWLIFFIGLQFWPLAIASMIYTVGKIFSFRHTKALLIFGILFVSYSVARMYFNKNISILHPLTAIILLSYITASSWKKLKGAQWAIVAGIVSTAIFSFTWAYFYNYYNQIPFFPHNYLYQSGEYLSLPTSLMIYVAMRFKEILTDVRANAKQVLQLSEEKKEQALKQQKILEEEVARQTIELRTSLENLKSTQAQLIQSEKMASLGELTAGIAHEIQNPLNFVNNFSEVSKELLDEMKTALENGDENEAKEIAHDVIQNLEKINHHGKRADAIVKGMLQHSRSSNAIKEPTDINALTDEYIRLCYHGLRAKDNSFNAIIKTNFHPLVGNTNIIPQDIGRVILNLLTNAFYAVNEKKKQQPENLPAGQAGYEPIVSVSTRRSPSLPAGQTGEGRGEVEIKVADNGNGIPQKILHKIFQPFFTTKPTGQGTGLGLSLSYDIIKAHGGEIKVATKEGEGTEFIIKLPVV